MSTPSPMLVERPRNRLLSALPDDVYAEIAQHLTPTTLHQRDIIYEYNQPIPAVCFPNTGVVSWLSEGGEPGELVEVATCGYEGYVGTPLFLGVDSTPGTGIVQIAGAGYMMPAKAFVECSRMPGPFRDVLGRYTQVLMNSMAQTAVCNRVHPINERCARWLLLTHDRVGGDTFGLTQEFLAQMLGVRRASVTVAASMLQQAGFITYSRGSMTILNREGLEGASCDCYGIVRETFETYLGTKAG